MRPLVVIGAGGHAREIVASVRAPGSSLADRKLLGLLAADDRRSGRLAELGLSVIGPPERLVDFDADYVVGVGNPGVRRRLDEEARERTGRESIAVVHPSAVVGSDVEIAPGCYLAAATVVTVNAILGHGVHVNVGASIHHDCELGAFTFVGPGARVGGWVTVGDGAFIGIGAVLKDEITIGAGATVGAGAVVIRDVEPDTTVVGNPARAIAKAEASGLQ